MKTETITNLKEELSILTLDFSRSVVKLSWDLQEQYFHLRLH